MESIKQERDDLSCQIDIEIKIEPEDVAEQLKDDAEEHVLGHASFDESQSCASLQGISCSRKIISGKPGEVWRCWRYCDASTSTEEVVAISPVKVGDMPTEDGNMAPMYLMGYFRDNPVYRTTMFFAQEREGHTPGSFEWHWPAVFPHVLVSDCGMLQADVTIRTTFEPPIISVETDEFSNMD